MDDIIPKFYYYYLSCIKDYLQHEYYKGVLQESLDIKNLNRMKIPIPPLDIQKQIVQLMERMEGEFDVIKTLKKYNEEKKRLYLEKAIKNEVNKDRVEIKKLCEVCTFKKGTPLAIKDIDIGEYPVYGSGINPIGYHNEYNMEPYTIMCAMAGCGCWK